MLYDRYSKVAYSLAYRIVGDHGSAEDIVQDAFLAVWRQANKYRRDLGAARSWLLAIVHHRSIDRLRSSASSGNHVPIDELPESKDEAPDPWQQVWSDLRGDVVRKALGSLPNDQRKSIELAYFSGYTHVEISQLMGVPLGTVKGRLRAGLLKLKALLDRQNLGAAPA
ncbi:MAG: sigma-70 family RNA polymerase sigma factor [Candidatus Eremiobacteraeota bacterium]|nr:sigma-70 family RNA polymerase sigma factor [Candidatus Eremiobacteraeota bacterium]MBC5827923.1 sigma-70 family RNA polymerase sigma factor [Candidatus Eremiobacteraeota bacterium]